MNLRKLPLAATAVAMMISTVAVGPATAQGSGERLYPNLGSNDYDVRSYDVAYGYKPGTTLMNSSVDIKALATRSLSSFSLDAVAKQVSAVSVNGLPAEYKLDNGKEKLDITPKLPLLRGLPFRVRIAFTADRSLQPKAPQFPEQAHFEHWIPANDGFALLGQPDRSHLFFPMNDIPSDKAVVTFRVTVPSDLQAVAGGTLRSKKTVGGRTTYVYTTRDPIPTDVAQLAVGHFTEIKARGPHGLPVRSYVDTPQAKAAKTRVDLIPGQLRWVEEQLGTRYPFETYGVLGIRPELNVALESATLSMFTAGYLAIPETTGVAVMVHELVHQYFGNAVSVRSWDDMWLSEGHASYYGGLYASTNGGPSFEDFVKRAYDFDLENRPVYGPPGRPADTIDVLGGTNAGGAVMLYGLSKQVGPKTFRQIEHTFIERYRNKSATTQDYIDVANQVSGKDLTAYITSWIYAKTTPELPS
ncbi:M1 family metallopeptidase [Kribbella sp. NPDC051620]|uniref:M1 family metallopeptidase n=1 Tax=Kribbella sp. NPDC051620 TaxID=3364120 RepID=UPI003788C656